MKKNLADKTKPQPYHPLFGRESDGKLVLPVPAPPTLDYNSSGFELTTDGYYNYRPDPELKDHDWKQTERGYYSTTSLRDIEKLLGTKRDNAPYLTDRCVRRLKELDYVVTLIRVRFRTSLEVLRMEVTCSRRGDVVKIVEDSQTVTEHGIGKWKL